MGFFPSGPNIRLLIDSDGNLVDMFAWIDNVSMGLSNHTEVDIQIDGTRIHGNASITEPQKARDLEFRFDAAFDVELMQID